MRSCSWRVVGVTTKGNMAKHKDKDSRDKDKDLQSENQNGENETKRQPEVRSHRRRLQSRRYRCSSYRWCHSDCSSWSCCRVPLGEKKLPAPTADFVHSMQLTATKHVPSGYFCRLFFV